MRLFESVRLSAKVIKHDCEEKCETFAGNVPLLGDVAMQAERVVSAKIEFIRENRVEATQNQQWSLSKCYHCRTTKENLQSESTKNFDNPRRLGKLDAGFLNENFRRLFLRGQNSFQQFAFQFSIQFSQSKSTKKIRDRFPQRISRTWILYK